MIIGAGGLSGFIHYRGGLDVLVTDYVSRHYPALSTSFSDLKWHVQIAGPVLTLKASDVELSYGEQSIEIPSLDFSFTPASLVTGMPTSIIVDADRIEIERARSGWQFADHPEWLKIQGSEAVQFFISEQLGQFSDFWKFWPSGLRRLQIQSEQLVIKSAEQLWQDISFTNISMSAAPEEGNFARGNIQLTARLSQQVETGQIVPRLFTRATANLFSGLTEFQLEASHVQIGELSALITDNRFIEALQPGIVSGQLSGAFDLSAMQMLSGDISFKDGQFTLPSIAQTPAAFHSAELSFEYSPSDNLLLVSKAGISLATGQNFHASGRLTRWNGPTSHISGQILIDDIALADLVKKWPEGQADMLKDFVTNQTSAGRLRTMALQLDGYVDWKEGQLDLSSVNLSGEVSNLRLAYKDEQYLSVVGTVGGQFEVSLGGQGQIETATGSLSLRNGFASVRNYDDTIKIPQIDAMLRYQPEESFLQNLFIDFADKGQILAHAKRSLQQGHYISEINLSWPKLDYQLARHIWPDKFAQKTQNWMDKHIRNGLSENAEISVHISEDTPKPEVTLLEGKIPFSDMTFVLFDDLMEVRALTGQLELADNQLSAQFGSGQTQGLDLEQANVTFAPMLAPE